MRKHALWNASAASYWLNCGVYTKKKIEAEAAGVDYNPDNVHTVRGHVLHEVLEDWLTQVHGLADSASLEDAIGRAEARHEYVVTDEDRDQLTRGVLAVANLTARYGSGALYLIEQSVPLSHEPGSNGYVDLAVILRQQRTLIVCDHKFGRMTVDPTSTQNRIYAANLLRLLQEKINWRPERVILAINQPALYTDVVVAETTADELDAFRARVEATVERQRGGHANGPDDLDTCTYCPFENGCEAREALVRNLMGVVEHAPLTDAEIEHIRRNKAAIEKVLKDCTDTIVANPARFPNWYRNEVPNARKWSDVLDQTEIGHQLRLADCVDIYTLRTPAQIKDQYPQAAGRVDELSTDAGVHVRLRYSETPVEQVVEEPAKRPAATRKSATKAVAKKKGAAKKAAKKGK